MAETRQMLHQYLVRPAVGLLDRASAPMLRSAVRNAERQCARNDELWRCDLAIFDRIGHVHDNLLRVAEADPDRMKQDDVSDELRAKVDDLLFAKLLLSDWKQVQAGQPSHRLHAVAESPGYLEQLGIAPTTCAEIRASLGVVTDDPSYQQQLLAQAFHPAGSDRPIERPALPAHT